MSQFFINSDIESDERFDMARFMNYTDNFDPLTSRFFSDLKKLAKTGEYAIQGEEEKPDLVSTSLYENTQYWWIILAYNDMLNVGELLSGKGIGHTSVENIEDLLFNLKTLQVA